MILQRDLTAEKLSVQIRSLLSNSAKLKRMAEKSKEVSRPEATSLLVDEMDRLLKKRVKIYR